MVVRLRLYHFGCKNKPFYQVITADSISPRDGKHQEVLVYSNPLEDEICKTMEELLCECQRRIAERIASSSLARTAPRKDQVEGKSTRASTKTDKGLKIQSVKEINRISSAKVREI